MRKNYRKRWVLSLVMLLATITATAQKQFCMTYEDFISNQWEELDSIHVKAHSKTRQVMWGGNDYVFSTGNKNTDRLLKKQAFAVMTDDTIFVNCRNLRYEGTRFGSGYVKARRIGERSLLIVNRIIGKDVVRAGNMSAFMFGAIGGAVAATSQIKQQVCYIISNGKNGDGKINIRLIDDELIKLMLEDNKDLLNKYFLEENEKKRMRAEYIIPLLEQAGLFNQNHESLKQTTEPENK